MNGLEYSQYLDSDAWKQRRTHVRRRSRGWCERCKVGRIADVHHLTYERVGNEDASDLIAVCRPCHEYLHGLRDADPAATKFTKQEAACVREIEKLRSNGNWKLVGWLCDRHHEYEAARRKREQSIGNLLIGDPAARHLEDERAGHRRSAALNTYATKRYGEGWRDIYDDDRIYREFDEWIARKHGFEA